MVTASTWRWRRMWSSRKKRVMRMRSSYGTRPRWPSIVVPPCETSKLLAGEGFSILLTNPSSMAMCMSRIDVELCRLI